MGLVGGATSTFPLTGAIIDEIFTTAQYFPRAIATELVDTRSTAKFVTDSSGLLTSVAINTLPISNTGLLVEPAATNLVLRSGELANGAIWVPGGSGSVAPTVTANATAAPDGTVTATQLAFPAVSGVNRSELHQSTTFASNVTTAWSVYLKGSVGGESVYIMTTPDGVNYARLLCTLTTSWQRFSFTGTLPGGTLAQFFQIGVDLRDAGQTAKSAQTIFATFAQIEAGSASSYFPTFGAALTRSADSIVIQRTGIGRVVFTFDDNSQQTISGINTGVQYTIPTNLNRPLIKRMTGYAS